MVRRLLHYIASPSPQTHTHTHTQQLAQLIFYYEQFNRAHTHTHTHAKVVKGRIRGKSWLPFICWLQLLSRLFEDFEDEFPFPPNSDF